MFVFFIYVVKFLFIFLVSVVISIFLLCLIFVWILFNKLLIWFLVGLILILGFSKLVGWIICLIILFVCLILYGLGVVDIYISCFVFFLNFLNLSGWLFNVFGNLNLWLIKICFCVLFLLYMLWICGNVICDLLIIIN